MYDKLYDVSAGAVRAQNGPDGLQVGAHLSLGSMLIRLSPEGYEGSARRSEWDMI